MFQKLSNKEEDTAKQIVDIAIRIHKQLGSGLLESVYAKCFYYELQNRSTNFEKRLGFLINFHVTLMKDGIKRIIV